MEPFYLPPIPNPARGLGRQNRSPAYSFRQPQTQVNPLALRRLQLQDVLSQRREEENDPHYQQNYAKIMGEHPLAQDNKFLNEAFTAGSRANYRAAEHKFNSLEEGQKQVGKEDLAWIKATGTYAAMGGDPSAFTDKDGNHDWNALNAAHAKAVQATKSSADAANAGLPISKTVTKEGDTTVTREAPKAAKPELTTAQQINIAKMEGTYTGQQAQLEVFNKQLNTPGADKAEAQKNINMVTGNMALTKGQMDAVHKVITPPTAAAPVSTPSVVMPPAGQPAPPTPAGQPTSPAPAPASSTTPVAPPQGAIEHLKANPDLAPHFDNKYGPNASTEFLTE